MRYDRTAERAISLISKRNSRFSYGTDHIKAIVSCELVVGQIQTLPQETSSFNTKHLPLRDTKEGIEQQCGLMWRNFPFMTMLVALS
jgi:hypothetical protein